MAMEEGIEIDAVWAVFCTGGRVRGAPATIFAQWRHGQLND